MRVPKLINGALMMSAGLLIALLGGLLGLLAKHTSDTSPENALISLGLAIVLIPIGIRVFRLGKRVRQSVTVAKDTRPVVLYLRPFDADKRGRVGTFNVPFNIPLNFLTHAEEMASVFEPLGPFTVVAHPGERLPHLGGVRVWAEPGNWQDTVKDYLREARLVVARVGITEGLQWEVETCVEVLTPEKLILLLPGTNDPETYAAFHTKFKDRFPQGLPTYEPSWRAPKWIGGLIWFTRTWEPRLERVNSQIFTTSEIAPALERALRAYRAEYDLTFQSPCPPLRRIGATLIDALVIAALATVSYVAMAPLLQEANDGGMFLALFNTILLPAVYLVGFEVSALNATPGKLVFNLRVVGRSGIAITPMQAIARWWLKEISILIFPLGLISALCVVMRRRAVHDVISQTSVELKPH